LSNAPPPQVFSYRILHLNQEISAASVCLWVATWVPEMFYNFYLAKNHKTADYSATIEAKGKNKHILEIPRVLVIF
jgi:hypothetical protein